MKILILLVACWAVCLAGCTSTGPAPAPEDMPEAGTSDKSSQFANQAAIGSIEPAAEDDPGYWDEVICKRTPVTGTRLTRGQCHTRYDWARMEGAARETMREIENRPIPCRDGPACE